MRSLCLLSARYREGFAVWDSHFPHTKGSDDRKVVVPRSLAELRVSELKQIPFADTIEDSACRRG